MKKYFNYIIALLLFSFLQCKEDFPDAPTFEKGDQTYGWAIGKKNGKYFEASSYAKNATDTSIGIHFYTVEGHDEVYREVFGVGVGNVQQLVGKHVIDNNNILFSFKMLTSDGDVIDDRYDLDKSFDNFIEITSIDLDKKRIKGILQFRVNVRAPKRNPDNADFLQFKKLEFETTII